MQFSDFEEQIFSTDQVIHREIFKNPSTMEHPSAKEANELRAMVRRAVEDLILCTDMGEGISRLLRDPEARQGITALTIEAPLSRDDHKSAARRAFETTPGEPSSLPFYPYCSYLLELCNALELAEHR